MPLSYFAASVYDDKNNLISIHVSYDGLLYLSLDPGAYRVEVNEHAHSVKIEYLNVSLYETVKREIQLLEKVDNGIIEVKVAQENANIRLIYSLHYLPVQNYPNTISTDNYTFHVNNNKYLLVVTAPGHEPYTEEITINGQAEIRNIDLNPLEDSDDKSAVFAFAGEYPYTHVFAMGAESYDVPTVMGNATMTVKPNSYGYLLNVLLDGKVYSPWAMHINGVYYFLQGKLRYVPIGEAEITTVLILTTYKPTFSGEKLDIDTFEDIIRQMYEEIENWKP